MKTGVIAPQNLTASKSAESNASKELIATRAISNTTGGGATDILDRDGVQAEITAGIVMRQPDFYVRVSRSLATTVVCDVTLLHLYDSTGKLYVATSFSESANVTLSGAGGLDTGSEAASTWYYIWAIADGTPANDALMLSTSLSAPTMPGSYTYKRLVGVVYNDASSNFVDFQQIGNTVSYGQEVILMNGSLTTGAWTAMTSAPVVAAIPSFQVCDRAKILARNAGVSGVSTDSAGWHGSYAQADGSVSTNWGIMASSYSVGHVHEVSLHGATMYYYTNSASGYYGCLGFHLTLGLD